MDTSANWSLTGAEITDGKLAMDASGDRGLYIHSLPNLSKNTVPFTCDLIDLQVITWGLVGDYLFAWKSQNSSTTAKFVEYVRVLQAVSPERLAIIDNSGGGSDVQITEGLHNHTLRFSFLMNTSINISINTTGGDFKEVNMYFAQSGAYKENTTTFLAIIDGGQVYNLGGFMCFNGTVLNSSAHAGATPDTTFPIVNTTFNITNPKINDIINFTGNVTDETGLSTANITYNMSGFLTKINFTLSGTSAQISNATKIATGRGSVINFTLYVTDTNNNVKQNSTLITIANTIPNATNFVNTTGLHRISNQTLNWTPSDEPDSEPVNYMVFWDLDITPSSLYYNGTSLNITTNFTSDNTYFFQVKSMDNDSESALSPVFNITLDTGLPVLTINISNNTFTRLNNTFNFYLEDSFPYNLTVRIYKGANIYHTNTSSSVFGRFINITGLFNLTEDGNYTIEINASDSTSTSPKIDDTLTRSKKGEAEYVINDSLNKISYKMLIRFEDKNENELATPVDYKSYADYNSKGTHINFGLNVTSNRNGFVPVYDIQTANVNIAILNDSIKGHLVWHPYGVDFEGIMLVNGIERNYTIAIKRITITRVKVSIIPSIDIMNNDVVQFRSESIFGLNLIDIFNTLVIDRTAPTFISAFNRTADSSNSTTITTATNVNISIIGLDDLYLNSGNFSHNASGSWTNQSITIRGNQTPYHYVIGSGNFTANQVVGWKFYVYDIAGNEIDPIYTFSVGEVASTSTSSPTSATGGTAGTVPYYPSQQSTIDEVSNINIDTGGLLKKAENSNLIQSTRTIGSKLRNKMPLTTLEIGIVISSVVLTVMFLILVIFLLSLI